MRSLIAVDGRPSDMALVTLARTVLSAAWNAVRAASGRERTGGSRTKEGDGLGETLVSELTMVGLESWRLVGMLVLLG